MLSRLARTRAAADAEEGRWLLVGLRSAAHVHLGFGSFAEYVERLFGYTARSTQEKLRVAEALEELPVIGEALEEGVLNWSAVRELTRVAVANTEREWLEVARGRTVHQLEALVAGKVPGDRPASPTTLAARRHVLRFEVSPETLCLFRETMQKLRRNSATSLDDDAALLLMARQVLAGPGDDGRASYQIALSICPVCAQGRQQAIGELVPVGADVVAMADCDGQHLGSIQVRAMNESTVFDESAHTGASVTVKSGSIEKSASLVAKREARESADTDAALIVAKCDARESVRSKGVSAAAKCDPHEGAHTGDASVVAKRDAREDAHMDASVGVEGECVRARVRPARDRKSRRAKQTIPPATRRTVLRRDQQRCAVPGCRNSQFLDVHHIQPRSEGGGNDADNLITLCGAHHRAGHRGELEISGGVATGVRFRHADGTGYGQGVAPTVVETNVKVFAALRGLGFREAETRQVLAQLAVNRAPREARLEPVLREALAKLTAPRR
jgi:hypothetical protein